MTHSRPARTLFKWCSHSVKVLWGGANCFNTTTFLLNSWAGLFEVVYPSLYGMSWRHFTVSTNPEFLAKFTSGGNVAIAVLIKLFYGESTVCTGPLLRFKLNAIHGHATWQHLSPSPPLTLKIGKRRCQIARFTGGPCTYTVFFYGLTPLVGLDLLREIRPSHSDTPQSVGFLWKSDRPISKPCTWQHKHLRQTDRLPCPPPHNLYRGAT